MRSASLVFKGEGESVPTARRFAARTASAWGFEPIGADVALLVSELVTNAVHHTQTDGVLDLTELECCVRVEVVDGSPALPTVGVGDPRAESGRGLRLVQEIADAWGVEPRSGGKAVWFELTTPDANPVAS